MSSVTVPVSVPQGGAVLRKAAREMEQIGFRADSALLLTERPPPQPDQSLTDEHILEQGADTAPTGWSLTCALPYMCFKRHSAKFLPLNALYFSMQKYLCICLEFPR